MDSRLEVIIAARDNASAILEKTRAQMRGVGQDVEGADKSVKALGNSLGSSLRAYVGFAAGAAAARQFTQAVSAAADRQVAFNVALRAMDAGALAGTLQAVNVELERMGELETRVQRGGVGGIASRFLLGLQRGQELVLGEPTPEERAAQARRALTTATQVAEGRAALGVDVGRLGLRGQSLALDVQGALGFGNLGAAAAARSRIEANAAEQRKLELDKLTRDQLAKRPQGIAVDPATLDREARERAAVEEKYDVERKQRGLDVTMQDRDLAAQRAQNIAKTRQAEGDLAQARLEAVRQLITLEGDRFLSVRERHATEARLLAEERDLRLRTIKAVADAEAAAQTGPGRGENVAQIRRQEALDRLRAEDDYAVKSRTLASQQLEQRRSLEEQFFQIKRTLGAASLAEEVRRNEQSVRVYEQGTAMRLQAEQKLAQNLAALKQAQENAALGNLGVGAGLNAAAGNAFTTIDQDAAAYRRRLEGAKDQAQRYLSNKPVLISGNVLTPGIGESFNLLQGARDQARAGVGGSVSEMRDAVEHLLRGARGEKEALPEAIKGTTDSFNELTSAAMRLAGIFADLGGAPSGGGAAPGSRLGWEQQLLGPVPNMNPPRGAADFADPAEMQAQYQKLVRGLMAATIENLAVAIEREAMRGGHF